MARQLGKSLLLKIENPAASATFVTLGMLQTNDFSINTNPVEETNKDSVNDRVERSAGNQSLSASGTLFFDAGAPQQRLRDAVHNKETPLMQIVDPGSGTYELKMLIGTFSKTGPQEGSVEMSISLESAGDWTFTPS